MPTEIAEAPVTRAPLMLNDLTPARRRLLAAAARRRPVRREMGPSPKTLVSAGAVLAALKDPRSTEERVLDGIVDGLMAELGW